MSHRKNLEVPSISLELPPPVASLWAALTADHISHRCRVVPVACRAFLHSAALYCRPFYPALDKCRDLFQRQLDRPLVGTRECRGYDMIGKSNGIKPAVVTAGLVLK
jgi:hypothetical protein